MKYLFSFLLAMTLVLPCAAQRSNHVFVLMLENRSDAEALKYMPYLSKLASQYTQATQAYSPSHGSFNAYLEFVAGAAPKGGVSDGGICNGNGCKKPYTADNLVRELTRSGLTWRGYFQSMPSVGYMGTSSGSYVARHNPFPFLSDVKDSSEQQKNMVPWTSNFAADLASHNVANYTLLVPDLAHDGHNPSSTATALTNANNFLAAQLPALLNSDYFKPGGDGVLFITFDESDLYGDDACSATVSKGCGGHIFLATIGPNVKKNYQTSAHLMQNNILRGTCDLLGLPTCPGDAANTTGVAMMFNPSPVTVQLNTTSWNNAGPSVYVQGFAQSNNAKISKIYIYVDGKLTATESSASFNSWVPVAMGKHSISVIASDTKYNSGSVVADATRTY